MEIELLNFFKFFDEKNPNHLKAITEFASALSKKAPDELTNKSGWVITYRTPEVKIQPKRVVPW